MENKRVVIRTLDIGTDKAAEYFKLEKEINPALGARGLRVCLNRPEIFKAQLRALYRAACYGRLGILIPMVISLEEVLMVKEIASQVQKELSDEGTAYEERNDQFIHIHIDKCFKHFPISRQFSAQRRSFPFLVRCLYGHGNQL